MLKEFDLFRLHIPEEDFTPRRWILVRGDDLNSKVKEIINEIRAVNYKTYDIVNALAKSLQTTSRTIFRHLNGGWIGLPILIELINFWRKVLNKCHFEVAKKKMELQKCIFELRANGGSDVEIIKAVKRLSEELAEIAGAHAADGTIVLKVILSSVNKGKLVSFLNLLKAKLKNKKITTNIRKKESYMTRIFISSEEYKELYQLWKYNKNDIKLKLEYNFSIVDEDKKSVEAIAKRISKIFGIKSKNVIRSGKDENSWEISYLNKIILRYLHVFFEFDYGSKSHNVDMPEIIRTAPFKYRKAFVRGAITFDGSVNIKCIYFGVKSKKFRDSVAYVLKSDGLTINLNVNPKDRWELFTPDTLSKNELRKWISYFIPKSEKWYRIYEVIYGFNRQVKSIEEAKYILEKIYPKKLKISLSELIDFVKETEGDFTVKDLVKVVRKYTNINSITKDTIRPYLRLLEKMNIVKKSQNESNIYLRLDENLRKELIKLIKSQITFKELTIKLNVSPTMIRKWLIKNERISLKRFKEILNFLGLNFLDVKNGIIDMCYKNMMIYNDNIVDWKLPSR